MIYYVVLAHNDSGNYEANSVDWTIESSLKSAEARAKQWASRYKHVMLRECSRVQRYTIDGVPQTGGFA